MKEKSVVGAIIIIMIMIITIITMIIIRTNDNNNNNNNNNSLVTITIVRRKLLEMKGKSMVDAITNINTSNDSTTIITTYNTIDNTKDD